MLDDSTLDPISQGRTVVELEILSLLSHMLK